MKIPIVYEDADLLIAEKPTGIPTCPIRNGKRSFEEVLTNLVCASRLTACHRLDSDTSGLVIFARNRKTYEAMRKLFSKDRVEREYLAEVEGFVKQGGKIDWPIGPDTKSSKKVKVYKNLKEARRHGAQEAVTSFTPIPSPEPSPHKRWGGVRRNTTWLHITIKGGRRHQIRAHLAAIGHPVIRLHASRLAFSHPDGGGKRIDVRSDAPLPIEETTQPENRAPHRRK